MTKRILYLDMDIYPSEPDFLEKLPGFVKSAGYDAWGLEWSRFFPWTIHARFGAVYKYPESCVNGLIRISRKAGVPLFPAVNAEVLSALIMESGCFDYMKIRRGGSLYPDFDGKAVGLQRLLEELLDDIFSLYVEENVLLLGSGGNESTRDLIHGIERYMELHQERKLIVLDVPETTGGGELWRETPADDYAATLRVGWDGPFVRGLCGLPVPKRKDSSPVFAVSRDIDNLMEQLEEKTAGGWDKIRSLRELILGLQEKAAAVPFLRDGESALLALAADIRNAEEISIRIKESLRGIVHPPAVSLFCSMKLFPLKEEEALLKARLEQFAAG